MFELLTGWEDKDNEKSLEQLSIGGSECLNELH